MDGAFGRFDRAKLPPEFRSGAGVRRKTAPAFTFIFRFVVILAYDRFLISLKGPTRGLLLLTEPELGRAAGVGESVSGRSLLHGKGQEIWASAGVSGNGPGGPGGGFGFIAWHLPAV